MNQKARSSLRPVALRTAGAVLMLVLALAAAAAWEPRYEIRISDGLAERARTSSWATFAQTLAPMLWWPLLAPIVVLLAARAPVLPQPRVSGVSTHLAAGLGAALLYAGSVWATRMFVLPHAGMQIDLFPVVWNELPYGLLLYAGALSVATGLLYVRGERVEEPPASAPALPQAASEPLEKLLVRSGRRLTTVRTEDIEWVGASGPYSEIRAGGRVHVLRMPLAALETRLDSERFVRVHRSTIVNLSHVHELRERRRGDYTVVLQDGTELNVSRARRAALTARLGPRL